MGDLGLCHVVTNSTFEQIREMAKGDAIRDLCGRTISLSLAKIGKFRIGDL